MSKQYRYIVYIAFRQQPRPLNDYTRTTALMEGVKTLKEARSYREMIDDSVLRAHIFDKVKDKVVEVWAEN